MEHIKPQGTGESGLVRPLTKEEFRDCMTDDWYFHITTEILTHFKVQTPKVVKLGNRKDYERFHGLYNPRLETVTCSHRWTGLYIHELAHHIVHKLHLNGRHVHHNKAFWDVLQECIYIAFPEIQRPVQRGEDNDKDFWSNFQF